METQTHNEPSKITTMPKNKEAVKSYTVFELETMHQVINSRGTSGSGIKDLRLLSGVAKKVKSAIPDRPLPPTNAAATTDEDKKKQMEGIKEWQKALEERVDQLIEVDFSAGDLMVIKSKLRGFSGYATDEDVRERLVVLFDKLDIQ